MGLSCFEGKEEMSKKGVVCQKCGSTDAFWQHGSEGFLYYHCRKCKHIFPVREKEPHLLMRIFMPLVRLIFGKCHTHGHDVEYRKGGVLPTRYYYKCLRCGREEDYILSWECPDCGNVLDKVSEGYKPLGGERYGSYYLLKCNKCGWSQECPAF